MLAAVWQTFKGPARLKQDKRLFLNSGSLVCLGAPACCLYVLRVRCSLSDLAETGCRSAAPQHGTIQCTDVHHPSVVAACSELMSPDIVNQEHDERAEASSGAKEPDAKPEKRTCESILMLSRLGNSRQEASPRRSCEESSSMCGRVVTCLVWP